EMRKRVALLVTGLAMLLLGATARPALAVSYNLTSDHCSGGCGPAGTIFGTVTLLQNGSTVDVTVHLNSPFVFANTGAVDGQAFLFNAVGVVVGDFTVDQTEPGETLEAHAGPFSASGIGDFGWGIACTTCDGGLADPVTHDIVFHVANAVIADLTAPISLTNPNVFAADLGNTQTGATGPIDATCANPCTRDITETPEPTTLVLM